MMPDTTTAVALRPPVNADIVELTVTPALRREWDDVFAYSNSQPSTSFAWTDALVRHHVGPTDRSALIRVRRGDRVVGFVPLLVQTRTLLGQHVRVMGPLSERYNTHSDLLLGEVDDETIDVLLEAILAVDVPWDCFRMTKVVESDPLLALLEAGLRRRRARHLVRYGLPAYFLSLPATFDEYLATRSSKFRNFLKRLERRIRTAGEPSVEQVTDVASVDAAYDLLLDIERASWKEGQGTSISAVRHQVGFYRDLCRAALDTGHLHLQFLKIDGVPVAYDLGFLRQGCYSYLKTSYRADYRHISPATFLRARLVESLISQGVHTLDFPGEPYEWERQWTDTVRWHKVLTIYRAGTKGRLLASLDRLRHGRTSERRLTHVDPRALRPGRDASRRG